MIHSIGYLGPFDPNIGRLSLNSDEYIRYDGTAGDIDQRPGKVNGIFFGYLEKPNREFFAVRARYGEQIVNLENPVPLDPERHTDRKGFGPKPSQFGDESAARLLRDMIAANPSQRVELNEIGKKTGIV